MRFLIFFIFFLVNLKIVAQQGNIVVQKDPRVTQLITQKGNITPPATAPQINGYRIQLVFDSNKKVIDDARNIVLAQNLNIDTYVNYNAPNFTLKVGDYRTKLDAERARDLFVKDFPASFVIKETINLPRID